MRPPRSGARCRLWPWRAPAARIGSFCPLNSASACRGRGLRPPSGCGGHEGPCGDRGRLMPRHRDAGGGAGWRRPQRIGAIGAAAPGQPAAHRHCLWHGRAGSGGAALLRLEPSPGTAAAYAQAQSALQAANALVRRTQTLLGQHLATRQQLADARKSQADARAALAALAAEGAGAAQILRAPFRAIVTAVSTSPGAIVAQGAALLALARPNALVLRVGVMPDRALAIRPGEPASITPLGAEDSVTGRVVLRGSVVEPTTGLVPVEIALPPGTFLAGTMAKAGIVIGKVHGYIVPHQAILVDDSGAPYVVQAVNMVARKVAVRVLDGSGAENVVAGPLDPAAPLVLAGNYQLENGMRIRLANPDGTAGK